MIITRSSGIKDVAAIQMMTFKTTELVVVKNVIAIVIIVVSAAVTVNSISAYDRIYYSLLAAIVTDITVVAAW